MKIKPVALPRPPAAEAAAMAGFRRPETSGSLLSELVWRRSALVDELGVLEAEIERVAIESICGTRDDTQHVEAYDGTLGVTRQFVDAHERAVGQLQWLADLPARFSGPGESPGNVSGERWGSGGLIAEDLFLTAGHCFDQSGGGWQRPRRNLTTIAPNEIALLMQVNFGYQVDGQTGQTRPGESFPIEELVEYRLGGIDYAIIRMGTNAQGQLPGAVYGTLALAESDFTTPGGMLCLIQHPSGRPKVVEAGAMLHNLAGQIAYDTLDTEGGSSGAPILSSPAGEIVGVHTNGGCTAFSGANFGAAIGAIRSASPLIP